MSIQLTKGQRIKLTKKNGSKLENMCVGANWGAIHAKGFFGGDKIKAVDLDLSACLYDASKKPLDVVYFGKLELPGLKHSGDDLVGDTDGDDGLDNEVITINLSQVDPNVAYIALVLNSYNKVDFNDIPFASIRIYEGTPTVVKSEFAQFKIAHTAEFAGSLCMVLGALYKKNDEWKFNSIGAPTKDSKLQELVGTATKFL